MNIILINIYASILLLNNIKTDALYAEYPDYTNENDNLGHNDYTVQNDQRLSQNNNYIDQNENVLGQSDTYKDLNEHTMVMESNVFPYMAAILKGSKYLSSGALVDEKWVLTTADGLFLMGESIRLLRVRLGSINYKRGGLLLPVKMIEFHPYFDDRRPNFDLALIMLAKPVRYTPNLRAIRLQMTPREVKASHFTVTSWPGPMESKSKNTTLQSMEMIKRHRILSVTHLHPSDPEECTEELKEIGTTRDAIMCLDPAMKDPCTRDIGAPVVLNNILWAMVSSWKPDDCDESSGGPIFATLVASKNVSSWIHATVHGHRWKQA